MLDRQMLAQWFGKTNVLQWRLLSTVCGAEQEHTLHAQTARDSGLVGYSIQSIAG
jgi:hypothetical protein